MKSRASILVALVAAVSMAGCVAPRLGETTIRYDNTQRAATPSDKFVPIYESRADVPFPFVTIGEVQAAPIRSARAWGYDPIELLKQQARNIGGIALIDVRSGESEESRHVWKAKVIAAK